MQRNFPGLAALAGLLVAGAAQAGGLGVSPVRLQVTPSAISTMITVRNDGSVHSRYEVNVYSWSAGADGEPRLEPTDDVLFFPRLFELDPGESRLVRLGAAAPFGDEEKPYRVLVQELPPLSTADAPGLRVLSRVSLPLFFIASHEAPGTRIEATAPAAGKLGFTVRNTGNVHLRPQTVHARALDKSGAALAEKEWTGWYVLPGGRRDYQVELGPELCARVEALDVKVDDGKGGSQQRLPLSPAACAGP